MCRWVVTTPFEADYTIAAAWSLDHPRLMEFLFRKNFLKKNPIELQKILIKKKRLIKRKDHKNLISGTKGNLSSITAPTPPGIEMDVDPSVPRPSSNHFKPHLSIGVIIINDLIDSRDTCKSSRPRASNGRRNRMNFSRRMYTVLVEQLELHVSPCAIRF